ncbi:MAG TPA: hypothetical protein VID47_15045 [Actinomycetota bacterium]
MRPRTTSDAREAVRTPEHPLAAAETAVVTRPTPVAVPRPEEHPGHPRLRRAIAAAGGPALIAAAVLVVQHAFAFGGMVTNQHPDILAMWLPTHCFLGSSLAAGHVPAWNPVLLGGTPFAADPQSGWMYLPAMAFSTFLSCGTAIRWFIVFQPLLAGLGMYAFLRSERCSRVAATSGGLVMGLLIGGSYLGVQLPFAGALAWTTVLLATTSRFVRTRRGRPARLGWLLAAAVAWGQVASAHLSNGLVVGSFALAVYLAAALRTEVTAGRLTGKRALALAGLLLLALPLVNLAVLLPRIAYLPGTTAGLGYGELARRGSALIGKARLSDSIGATTPPAFPLTLVEPIGGFAGAVAMAFALGGWRRPKPLFVAFGAFAGACFLLSLGFVARLIGHVIGGTTLGELYLHVPGRFTIGVALAVPVLVALGVDAWRAQRTWRERLWVVAPGVMLWWVVAPATGNLRDLAWLPLAAAMALVALMVGTARRPALIVALPMLIAIELVVGGVAGQAPVRSLHGAIEVPSSSTGIPPLRRPEVPVAAYLRPGPIVQALRHGPGGRYATIPPFPYSGLIPHQEPRFWPLLGNQRGLLFGLETPDGVNPVQSVRHWTFVRATQRRRINYNSSFASRLSPLARDLFQVNAVVVRSSIGCEPRRIGGPATPVAEQDGIVLCRLDRPVPRATVVGGWTVVPSRDAALAGVTARGFDPGRTALLEHDPGLGAAPSTPATGTARYRSTGPQSAVVDVRSSGPAIVLIRTTFDPGWHATVDGRPAVVLAGDYVDQAVAVPAGHHVIVLGYDDPWVGWGVAGSVLVIVAVGGVALALALRRSRRARTTAATAMTSSATTDPSTPRPTLESR